MQQLIPKLVGHLLPQWIQPSYQDTTRFIKLIFQKTVALVTKNLTAIFNFKRNVLENEDIFFSKLTPEKHLPAFLIFEAPMGTQDTGKTGTVTNPNSSPSVTARVWRT